MERKCKKGKQPEIEKSEISLKLILKGKWKQTRETSASKIKSGLNRKTKNGNNWVKMRGSQCWAVWDKRVQALALNKIFNLNDAFCCNTLAVSAANQLLQKYKPYFQHFLLPETGSSKMKKISPYPIGYFISNNKILKYMLKPRCSSQQLSISAEPGLHYWSVFPLDDIFAHKKMLDQEKYWFINLKITLITDWGGVSQFIPL